MGAPRRRQHDLAEILAEVGRTGAARIPALRLDRTGQRALNALIRRGDLRRRGQAVYLPQADPAIVIACRENGLLTCGSALPYYGLADLLPREPVHLAVPATRSRLPASTCTHREMGLTVPERSVIVPPERLAARLLRCAPEREAIALVDQMLNQRTLLKGDVMALLRGNRHGCPEARRRLARCTDRARSPIESLARVDLEDAGFTVEPGVVIPGVGETDMLVEGRLVVETDGYTFHSSRDTWRKDRWRDQELMGRGMLTLRLTFDDVMAGRTVKSI